MGRKFPSRDPEAQGVTGVQLWDPAWPWAGGQWLGATPSVPRALRLQQPQG